MVSSEPASRTLTYPLSTPPNLVVIDEVEVLQCGDDIFFLDTSDFTDLTVGIGGGES